MLRSFQLEILDDPGVAESLLERTHRDLLRVHKLLGNITAVALALRRDPLPVRRVLDVGCGRGHVLQELRRRLPIEVVGVDLRPHPGAPVPMVRADAVRDPLPEADVAVSLLMAHHLAECELIELLRNVGRSCRRFVLLDLVRHPLPLWLFRLFVAPFLSTVAAQDGLQSVRRAYTPAELGALAAIALQGSGARFEHRVGRCYVRQLLDIRYRE